MFGASLTPHGVRTAFAVEGSYRSRQVNPDGCGGGRGVLDKEFSPQDRPDRGPHVIAYRAMLDVPGELVRYLARLLAAERRTLGTRPGTRALTCPLLPWFRCDRAGII